MNQFNNRSEQNRSAPSLPIWKLLAFTVAGFITIMTEIIPAGLLALISHDLEVSEALAGQMISVYALGSVIAAIPVVAATRSWSRKPLLLLAITGLFVFNSLTALSSSYIVILISRFIAGMSAGIIWGILAGYARSLVPAHLQGRAMAIVGVGQPIALCMGVPLAIGLGNLFGWRGVFWMISGLALILIIWIKISLPHLAGQPVSKQQSILNVLVHPGIGAILAVIFVWILAHNILYTFISPYLSAVQLSEHIDLILLIFGLSSIFGIWITGIWIDRSLRKLTLISLTGFAIAALFMGFSSHHIWLVMLGIVLWGITFGGAPTLLQTALADVADENVDIAQSMLVTVFNLAVAGGGILGGILLQNVGIDSFFVCIIALSLLGLSIVFFAHENGFKSGHRLGRK